MNDRISLLVQGKKDQKKLSGTPDFSNITDLHIEKADELAIDFSVFPSVRELWIDSRQPCRIPETLLQLRHLDKLIVGGHCILPAETHRLESLRELWLKDHGIIAPPPDITRSSSIRELNIAYYGDVEPRPIPEWIFGMTRLEKIRFSVCRFTAIGERINQLTNLVELDLGCSFSDLQSFPDLSGLEKLRRLAAASESVQGQKQPAYSLFPQVLDGIRNLRDLDCLDLSGWKPRKKTEWPVTQDKRHSIPDVFDRHPHLHELSLGGMNMDFIPETVLRLAGLKKLKLNGNKLSREEIGKIIRHLPRCMIDSDIVCYKPR